MRLVAWLTGQPRVKGINFRISLVVVQYAPDFVDFRITLDLLLGRSRDSSGSPLSFLGSAYRHVREIEVANESPEVARLGSGCFAQE